MGFVFRGDWRGFALIGKGLVLDVGATVVTAGVVALAAGAMIAGSGVMTADPVTMAAGGALAAIALTGLLVLGAINGLPLIVLSVALPGITVATGERMTVAAPVTALVVLSWFADRAVARAPWLHPDLPRIPLGAFVVALLISVAAAQNPLLSSRELLNLGVLIALLAAAADQIRRRPDLVPGLIMLLVIIAAVSGVAGVLETLGILPGQFRLIGRPSLSRAAGTFGQPNALGMFLAAVMPFAVHIARHRSSIEARMAGWAAVGAIAAGLLATVSRGSWLALLAGTVSLLAVGRFKLFFRMWAVIITTIVAFDLVTGGLIRDTILRSMNDWIITQRFALMTAGLLMFVAHPWTGVGLGGFAETVEGMGAAVPTLGDIKPTPHNAFIQMGAEAGIFGFVTYIALLGAVFIVLLRNARIAARDPDSSSSAADLRIAILWSFATSCGSAMVEWPLAHGVGQVVVLVMAMGIGLGRVKAS